MFNALNRFISRLDGDPQGQKESSHGAFGFQVLRNTNLELNIEPWFDFIVGEVGIATLLIEEDEMYWRHVYAVWVFCVVTI